MKVIGTEIETDDLANVHATLPGSDPEAKRIVMGSHVDSVKNGGNYDSVLGVMTAMFWKPLLNMALATDILLQQ